MIELSTTDRLISSMDNAMRTVLARHAASRPLPRPAAAFAGESTLTDPERRLSQALMRVNHVGEVCAQALYDSQALTARDPEVREQLQAASRDETDHLASVSYTHLRAHET